MTPCPIVGDSPIGTTSTTSATQINAAGSPDRPVGPRDGPDLSPNRAADPTVFETGGKELFAERMGVHRAYFSSVERGERNLTLQTLEKIADFLGVDPRTLLADPL